MATREDEARGPANAGARVDMIAALADAWEKADIAAGAVAMDRAAAAEARGRRELVCDLVLSNAPEREVLTALHAYGRLLAERGASPSALAVTIDGARSVLPEKDAKALGLSARAAVTEGYFAAAHEAFAAEALLAWAPPAGIAKISDDTFAVSAQYPSREPDDVSKWATQIARWLKKNGAAKVFVEGDPQLAREVQDAILLAGLEIGAGDAGEPKKKGILSKILG